jgi:hypothetical protein
MAMERECKPAQRRRRVSDPIEYIAEATPDSVSRRFSGTPKSMLISRKSKSRIFWLRGLEKTQECDEFRGRGRPHSAIQGLGLEFTRS